MKTCDIGVVPMISTSIPNKVFDYIANDMPIYVLGQNDSSDFVKKYGIGWSTEFNTDGVKNFLNKINHKDIEDKRLKLTNIKNEFNRHNIHKKILNEIDS